MSNALTPDIRFKGFADDWEQRKLGDIADIIGGGTPSTSNSSYWDGDIDWYAPAEIADQIYANSSQRKITDLGYENSSAKILPPGTVLFTSRAGIGKTAILTRKGCTNQGFQSIVPHFEELDSYFIFSRTEELKRYGELVGAGSTFVEVSGKQMAAMELMMPKTMKEQQAIGNYFSSIDNLITLHQKELEKLIDIKKSMLINMFPQGDEKVPRIRFKGFSGDWNYPVLGTLGKTYTGLSGKTKEDFGHGDATYITYMNVFTNPITHSLQVDSIESDAMQNEVQEGDIFFTTSSETPEEVGMSSVLLAKSGTTYLNSFCFGYRLNENVKIDKYYLAYLLRSPVVREKIVFLAQGISRFNISKTKMMEIAIPVPEKTEEQEKIGAFFFNLDKLIEAQEKKIAQLKNIKSALLNKMFPKGDE